MQRWQMIAVAVVLGLLLIDGLLWRAAHVLDVQVDYDDGDYADEATIGV